MSCVDNVCRHEHNSAYAQVYDQTEVCVCSGQHAKATSVTTTSAMRELRACPQHPPCASCKRVHNICHAL